MQHAKGPLRTRPAIQSSSDQHTLSHRPVQTNLTVSEMVDTQLHNFSLLCSSETFSTSCTYISLSLPFNNQMRHLIRAMEMLVEQIKRSLSESSYLLQDKTMLLKKDFSDKGLEFGSSDFCLLSIE